MTAALEPTPPARADGVSSWSSDALLVAVAAALVRLPALFSPQHLGFDDGVYGASAVAMRHGGAPFRDVFSSQGPLFLPVVYVFDLLGGRMPDAPRLAALAAGVAVTVAVVAIARSFTDRGRALLAAGIVATSGCLLWTTGPLTSDGVAEAWACWAVVAALAYRRSPSLARAALTGALAGAAVSTKSLLVIPALVVAWLIVAGARHWRHAVLVPVLAAGVLLVAALPWGLHDVYDQSVRYHLDKTGERKPIANARKVWSTLWDRDLPLLAVGTGALVFGGVRRARRRRAPATDTRDAVSTTPDAAPPDPRIIAVWLALAAGVVVWQDPMWRNHIAHVIAPAALLVGIYRPPWRAVALAALVTTPVWAAHLRPVLWPGDYEGRAALVVRTLEQLPKGAGAVSDEPGLVWRADRVVPANFVDASRLRIEARVDSLRITPRTVAEAASRPEVCAVVVWSDRWSGTRQHLDGLPREFVPLYEAFDELPKRLLREGYAVAQRWDPEHVLYIKSACAPDDRTPAGTVLGRSRD